jgi:hypothetical protein
MEGYGQWVNDPDYGYVWQPTVAPGWAPYRYGRWVWEDCYGWTWVSYDPWGWAPYHWGRWYMGRGGWCWYPGSVYGPVFWRPALVAFFGFGPRAGFGVGFGFGFGNIGWVPLGPYEALHPWWGRGYYGGRGGFGVVNTNIVSTFRNARVMNGVTAVGAGDFGRRGINGNNLRVTAGDLRGAGLVRGQVPLTPGRESLRMSDRSTRATGFSQGGQFYSHMQASRVDRVSFAQQQRGMQQRSLNRPTGGGAAAQGNAQGNGSAGTGGWRRVGETPAQQRTGSEAARPSSPSTASSAGTWSRFGTPAGHGGYGGYNGGQPVHIAPQIVHERPSTGGGYGGYPSRGSSGAPAPAYHPAQAPSYHGSSAPAHSSSSSGGHSSGGGGHSSHR